MKFKLDLRSLLVGLLSGILLVVVLGTNNANQDHLKCESISVVDADGNTVAVLGRTGDGKGMLELKDADGTKNVIARDGAVVTQNSSGARTSYVGTTDDGDGIMKTYDQNGSATTYLGTVSEPTKGTRGSLKVYHNGGNLATRINDGFVQTYGSNNMITSYTGTSDDGTGILKTFGAKGTKVGYMGTSAEGNGILHLYDEAGRLRYMR